MFWKTPCSLFFASCCCPSRLAFLISLISLSKVENPLLCPSAGNRHLDLGTDLIAVRSKEGFKKEKELLSQPMIRCPCIILRRTCI